MATTAEQVLADLLAKASLAKSIGDQITCLTAWDATNQRQQVKLETSYRCRDEVSWPVDIEVRAIVELGRQTKLAQLQKQLEDVLGVKNVPDPVLRITEDEAEEIREQQIQESISRNAE